MYSKIHDKIADTAKLIIETGVCIQMCVFVTQNLVDNCARVVVEIYTDV